MGRLRRWKIILIAVICVAILIFYFSHHKMEVYNRFQSPDGQYTIVVLRYAGGIGFPGSSSDAPGVVRLVDKHDHLIREAKIDMVQQLDSVEWETNSVHLRDIGDWPLK